MNKDTEADRELLEVLGEGDRTWRIAKKLRQPTSRVRRQLGRLQAAGRVKIDERLSYINDYYWIPA